jgi:hypothetical protein
MMAKCACHVSRGEAQNRGLLQQETGYPSVCFIQPRSLVPPQPRNHFHSGERGSSAQLACVSIGVEYRALCITDLSVVLEHAAIHSCIRTLHSKSSLGNNGVDNEVIITVRAKLVCILEVLGIFPEALLALLAGEYQFEFL